MKVLILHGPNINLTGTRETEIYGSITLEEIDARLVEQGQKLGIKVTCHQSNHEGALIDALHEARKWADGVVFNPGGYSHTSVALRDAVAEKNEIGFLKTNEIAERSDIIIRPARNALKPVRGKLNNLIHNSMITLTQRTMHGRRVFGVGRSMFDVHLSNQPRMA